MPLALGLMSGTSVDGVDAAVCDISYKGGRIRIKIVAAAKTAYTARLRKRILLLSDTNSQGEQICRLNVEVAEVFAKAALKVLKSPALKGKKPEYIGSHGQTVFHLPKLGASLQIGDGSVIAARTGIKTWFDFRSADLALGGQGAPLAPVVHLPLFMDRKKGVGVVNIGGIANVTHIPAGAKRLNELTAYDTGPGCMVMDMWARKMDAGDFDRNGSIASKGAIDKALLKRMLCHPYFRARPPKSTGRETFGEPFLKWARLAGKEIASRDVMATLTELTAQTIADEIGKLHKRGRPTGRIVLCGGGALNSYLVKRIRANCKIEVAPSDALGVDCKLVEPALMALLAFYAEKGVALDLSKLTGSKKPVLLGKLAPRPYI
ncbi:Anhydro-N-acetylmuramic acid kinase [hydrothermal vent metagenome]|uniref:Anhydro-N-acetylmuramic acid kinase n=1 Tax=hydrothermal vent metagenome TaxID=652676 RepID=A0A3B1CHE2_9ZZZZ